LLKTALLLGVLVHLAGFFIFRVISNPLPSGEESPAFVALVSTDGKGGDKEIVAQADLFDSAPLFIPGEWSSASGLLPSEVLREWEAFPDFEPSIKLMDEVKPDRLSLPQAASVAQPEDLLDFRFWDLFDYFGQVEVALERPDGWASLASVIVLSGNDEQAKKFEIQIERAFSSGEFAERPVVFFVNMAAPGLIMGAPVLRQSSGAGSLDAEALEWLERPETMAKLPAGFLELRVYP
jgi:hypothetical protein